MIESLYIAETGLNSQQKMIDVISNNIANISTPGYKKANVSFAELVTPVPADALQEGITDSGKGVHVASVQLDFRSGELKQTGHPMDLAINGEGFLAVEMLDGETGYSRAGRLRIADDGFLTTQEGLRLQPGIQVPPESTDLTVTQSGNVLARVQGSAELIELGQLEVVRFAQPEALRAVGSNVFKASEQAGAMTAGPAGANGNGMLVQGFAEMANVSMNEEMVSLMLAQRGYQLNARLVQVADQVLETINNIRR